MLKQNKNKETALHYAMFNNQFRLPMARFLIKATLGGGDKDGDAEGEEKAAPANVGPQFVNAQNSKGETALHYGVRMLRPDVVQLLLGAGADISLENAEKLTPYRLAKSIEAKGGGAKGGAMGGMASAGGKPLPQIITALENAAFLRDWLDGVGLTQHVGALVRGGVTKAELPDLTEQHLADMGIASAGDRIRLGKAIKEFKKKGADEGEADGDGDAAEDEKKEEVGKSRSKKTKKKHGSKSRRTGKSHDDKKSKSSKKSKKKSKTKSSSGDQPDLSSKKMKSVRQQLEQLQYIKVDAGDWIENDQVCRALGFWLSCF